jgi:hypothetical protein
VSGGILLVLAGVWIATQVLAGNALQRLVIIRGGEPASDPSIDPRSGQPWNRDPKTGVPNQDPTKPYLRDDEGVL